MKLVILFLFLTGSVIADKANTGCPKLPVDPCFCDNSPYPYLQCDKIDDTDALKKVFINSESIRYRVVRITNSVLQYLPHEIFHNVEVVELQLYNVTLVQLFDETPTDTAGLEILHVENTYIFKGIIWEHLKPMDHLRIVNVYYNSIAELDKEFVENAPKSLEQLSLYSTKTAIIGKGVFHHFPLLDKLAIDHGRLSELTRDLFPEPFNARFLYFTHNHLRYIPENLFTNMPKLQTISLRNNAIATIPPNMFKGGFKNLDYLILDDNPLDCDCNLTWLLNNKRTALQGKCFSPANVEGKSLQELDAIELICQ